MIPCTDFIPAYSELFKFIEEKDGDEGVLEFWNYLSDEFLGNLKQLVEENGIRGCWLYWERALNEEAADFTMELDEVAGEFTITMHACPSKGRLLREAHIESYAAYCKHCDVLYRRVLEPLGYRYDIDLSRCDQAACVVSVRKATRKGGSLHTFDLGHPAI